MKCLPKESVNALVALLSLSIIIEQVRSWVYLVKDSQNNDLESTSCPKYGKKLSLKIQGVNPLSLEK